MLKKTLPVIVAFLIAGCGGSNTKHVYRAVSGYEPELPLLVAKARCEQIAENQAITDIQSAVNNAKGSSYSTTGQLSCIDSGLTISCNGNSYTQDTSGAAQVGAAFGAALANAMAKKERMKTCMAAMGYEQFEIDTATSYERSKSSLNNNQQAQVSSYSVPKSDCSNVSGRCIGTKVLLNGMTWNGEFQKGAPSGSGTLIGDGGTFKGIISSDKQGLVDGVFGDYYVNEQKVFNGRLHFHEVNSENVFFDGTFFISKDEEAVGIAYYLDDDLLYLISAFDRDTGKQEYGLVSDTKGLLNEYTESQFDIELESKKAELLR
jgi:hypothetical protein